MNIIRYSLVPAASVLLFAAAALFGFSRLSVDDSAGAVVQAELALTLDRLDAALGAARR